MISRLRRRRSDTSEGRRVHYVSVSFSIYKGILLHLFVPLLPVGLVISRVTQFFFLQVRVRHSMMVMCLRWNYTEECRDAMTLGKKNHRSWYFLCGLCTCIIQADAVYRCEKDFRMNFGLYTYCTYVDID